jgi:hypothetical protein
MKRPGRTVENTKLGMLLPTRQVRWSGVGIRRVVSRFRGNAIGVRD